MSESPITVKAESADPDAVLWATVTTGGTQDGFPYGMFFLNEDDARRNAANIGQWTPEGDEGWYALVKVSVPRSQLRRYVGTRRAKS